MWLSFHENNLIMGKKKSKYIWSIFLFLVPFGVKYDPFFFKGLHWIAQNNRLLICIQIGFEFNFRVAKGFLSLRCVFWHLSPVISPFLNVKGITISKGLYPVPFTLFAGIYVPSVTCEAVSRNLSKWERTVQTHPL